MSNNFKSRSIIFSLVLTFFLASAGQAQLPGQPEAEQAYRQLDVESPESKEGLTSEEREALLLQTSTNAIAKLSMVSHYDPKGDIGFCFGRASTAHLLARKMGLANANIRKLFVIGDLRSGSVPEWRFHVTTLVKGIEDGAWYAIDPIMRPPTSTGKPLLAQDWINVVQRVWDKPKQAHYYFVGNDNIVPDMTRFGATKADETGERIIELSFDPSTHTGFTPMTFGTSPVFELDQTAQLQHFIATDESSVEEKFSFLKLTMTVHKGAETKLREFAYQGYFLDLLENLTWDEARHEENFISFRAASALDSTDEETLSANDLGSMKLNF